MEWQRHPLKRIVRLNPSTLPDDTPPEQAIRYVDISNVQDGRISAPEEMLFGNAPSRARRLVQNGDVILSTVRTYLRAVALVEDADRLIVSTGFAVLRPDAGLRSRFLWYVLQSEPFVADVMRHSEGVSYPAIPPERLAALKIVVPDDKQQQGIADFLDRETAKIDALIERRRRLHELLDESMHALLSGLMESAGLSGTRLPLRRVVFQFIDYRGQTPTKTSTGVRLVTARNIKNGGIDYSESEEFIAESDYKGWMVRGLPAVGDLLITTEAPLGEVALIDESSVALAQRIILIKPNTLKVSADYLWCYFRSLLGRAELDKRATGSTAVGIKASHLRSIPVVVPSAERQRQIVDTYRTREREVQRIRRSLGRATDLLREERSALISAGVTGQIDVRQQPSRLP